MPEKINTDMTFGDFIQCYPDVAPILAGYGLHCIGCHIAVIETIEQGAMAHGLSSVQLNEMISELNKAV